MKRIFFIIILFFNGAFFLYCHATSQELFLQANAAYKTKDFKKALNLYLSIENKGAAVHFNLGNCYYHLEQYIDALLHWKQALKKDGVFLHEAVDYNCNAAYQKLGFTQSKSLIKKIIQRFNYESRIIRKILVMILTILILFAFFLYEKRQFLILNLFICFISISGGYWGVNYWLTRQEHALVKQKTSLIAGTDERFSKLETLIPGQEVLVKEKSERWCKVKSNDCIGWVLAENIEYI